MLAAPAGEFARTWQDAGHRFVEVPTHARGLRRADGRRPSAAGMATELARTAAAARRVASLARGIGADLLHSHALNAHVEVALAGRLARRPVVLDLHDIVVPGLGRRVLGIAARLADVVIANSRATASTVAAGRVEVVNPGVDTTRFMPGAVDPRVRGELAADPGAPVVAILGRVDPEKGVDVVIRAVAGLDGDLAATQLAVVGSYNVADAAFEAGLRALGAELLGDRVRFVGPRTDVPDVLRAVDVVVNASRAEPFGRTVLEAQASGVPVVGTDAGGIPEFVEHGRTGLLVPPGDPEALAAALSTVIGDAGLRTRLATAAVGAAHALAVPRQAARVAGIYRDAVSARG